MFCSNCGGKVVREDKYCSLCGLSLKTDQKKRIDTIETQSLDSDNKNQQKKEDAEQKLSRELKKKTSGEKISADSVENKSYKSKSKEKTEIREFGYFFKNRIVVQKPSKELRKETSGKTKNSLYTIIGYIFFFFFLIGPLSILIIPELVGSESDPKQLIYYSVLVGFFAIYYAKQRGKSGWVGFFVGFILAVIISNISLAGIKVYKRNREAVAVKEIIPVMIDDIEKIIEGKQIQPSIGEKGELKFFKDYIFEIQSLWKPFNTKMGLYLEGILDPDYIDSVDGINNQLRIVKELNGEINVFETKLINNVTIKKYGEVKELNIPADSKLSILIGMEQGLVKLKERFSSFRFFLKEIEEHFNFMKSRTDKYTILKGKLLFENQADMNQYNEFVERFSILIEKDNKRLADSQNKSSDDFKKSDQ